MTKHTMPLDVARWVISAKARVNFLDGFARLSGSAAQSPCLLGSSKNGIMSPFLHRIAPEPLQGSRQCVRDNTLKRRLSRNDLSNRKPAPTVRAVENSADIVGVGGHSRSQGLLPKSKNQNRVRIDYPKTSIRKQFGSLRPNRIEYVPCSNVNAVQVGQNDLSRPALAFISGCGAGTDLLLNSHPRGYAGEQSRHPADYSSPEAKPVTTDSIRHPMGRGFSERSKKRGAQQCYWCAAQNERCSEDEPVFHHKTLPARLPAVELDSRKQHTFPRVRARSRRSGFESSHGSQQFRVVGGAVRSRMNAPMAVGTKRDYETRIVRTTIAHASNVVGLEVGRSVDARKWCRRRAPLTTSGSSGKNISPNVPAALIDVPRSPSGGRRYSSSRHCRGAQISQADRNHRRLGCLDFRDHGFDWPKLKNERFPHCSFSVWSLTLQYRFAEPFAFISQPCIAHFAEEQQAFSIRGVEGDGAIATDHKHVADLAFAEILEDAIFSQPVTVAVLSALLASDGNDERMSARRNYPALLLACIASMDVSPSMIRPAAFKRPTVQRHSRLPAFDPDDSTADRRVGNRSCGARP